MVTSLIMFIEIQNVTTPVCCCQKYTTFALSSGEVRMPSGKTARPFIRDNKDGTVTVQFQPTERGLHEMDIKYDGNHIPGWTPFSLSVRNGPKSFWTHEMYLKCITFI